MGNSIFSPKPKLSRFAESIFKIGGNNEVIINGKVLPDYEVSIVPLNRGIGFQISYRKSFARGFLFLGGLHRSYLDVLLTINNHQRYLAEIDWFESVLSTKRDELEHLKFQDDYGDMDNLGDLSYTTLNGKEITIEELKSEITDLEYVIVELENKIHTLSILKVDEWNTNPNLF